MTQQLTRHDGDPARPGRITYEQFLDEPWVDPHSEWVDGEVIAMAPISGEHQTIGRFLLALLGDYVALKGLGTVQYEPFQMKTGPDLPGRAPDVMFVATANLGRMKRNHLEGPADIVVEIISPESRVRDRGEKFYEYEQGGVKEYWLIDPLRRRADFFILGDDGVYKTANVENDVFHSTVLPGFWLRLGWLWQSPTPPAVVALKEIGAI